MKKLKIAFLLIVLFSIFIFINAYNYVEAISDNLYNSVFRLHVIANSDSEEDQNLKYIVRDSLLNYMNEKCKNISSKDDIIQYAKNNLTEIKQTAENTIKENGYNYPVVVEIGNYEFPTKWYGDISFPEGFYDALRVKIGKAAGQNWWCVMFPPLCFVDVSSGIVPDESKDTIKNSLANEEEYILVNEEKNADLKIKFKLVEFFQNVKIQTAQN